MKLPGHKIQDPHRRLLQGEKIVIQFQRLLLPFLSHRPDHVKNTVGNLSRADRLNILAGDDFSAQGIVQKLLQFHMDISHIASGFFKKQFHIRPGDLFLFPFQDPQNPAHQVVLLLDAEFRDQSGLLDPLVQPASFVRLLLHKNQHQIVRQGSGIIRQPVCFCLKQAGIFQKNYPVIREKGNGLRQIDDLSFIQPFPLKTGKVHGVPLRNQSIQKFVPILLFQIGLRTIQKIGPVECSVFNVIQNFFHFLRSCLKRRLHCRFRLIKSPRAFPPMRKIFFRLMEFTPPWRGRKVIGSQATGCFCFT